MLSSKKKTPKHKILLEHIPHDSEHKLGIIPAQGSDHPGFSAEPHEIWHAHSIGKK